jgi:hypothetical protein
MSTHQIPEADQIDYHVDLHSRRAARALHRIDPGELLAVIDGKIAQEADPAKHPLYATEAIMLDWSQGIAVIKATVADGEGGQATGLGAETRKGFEDFVEEGETRGIGRALAALGIGTQFVGEELNELRHIADAPVASTNGQPAASNGDPEAAHITQDQARDLKKLAQTTFGYPVGETQLRQQVEADVS